MCWRIQLSDHPALQARYSRHSRRVRWRVYGGFSRVNRTCSARAQYHTLSPFAVARNLIRVSCIVSTLIVALAHAAQSAEPRTATWRSYSCPSPALPVLFLTPLAGKPAAGPALHTLPASSTTAPCAVPPKSRRHSWHQPRLSLPGPHSAPCGLQPWHLDRLMPSASFAMINTRHAGQLIIADTEVLHLAIA